MTRRTTSSRAEPDHDARWRPRNRRGPTCGYTFREVTCGKRGAHYCQPRADRAVRFAAELLVHTKGPFRRQPFLFEPWQEHEIIRPLFGEAIWSPEWQRYVRRYRIAHIIVARKNGKSELAAAIQLMLLVGDDEEAAEVYQAAKDRDQAEKVFGPARRMVQLSPRLAKRLKYFRHERRLVDEQTSSYYTVITADAEGELGHNPHGFNLDEVLSQPDGSLWDAMETAAGAREQELLFTTTTETNDSASFGAGLIDEAERIQEQPSRAPHVFVFVRKLPRTQEDLARLHRLFPGHPDLPVSTDPLDERNWKWPNPALDGFKSREAMRRQALTAKKNPRALNAFVQFQCNQRVSAASRWIPLDLWDANTGELALTPEWLDAKLAGRRCWGGLDLSSRLDLTAWCLLFDGGELRWRFWAPESVREYLDEHTDDQFSQWVDAGWIVLTEGDVIDYDVIHADIAADAKRFRIVDVTYDKWCGENTRQSVEKAARLKMVESATTYERMSGPIKDVEKYLAARGYAHGGNPVARWMADCCEVIRPNNDPDRARPAKPERNKSGKRIDGIAALLYAEDGRSRVRKVSVYESRGIAL